MWTFLNGDYFTRVLPNKTTAGITPEWIRVSDACRLASGTKPVLYGWMNRGLVRNFSARERGQVKGTRLVSLDSLRAFLESRATDADIPGVTYGDSLTARIDGKTVRVRLEGIDAPELKQPGGSASRDALREIMARAPYYLIPMAKDRYGRLLAGVEAAGNEVNIAMLRQGMAWHFTRYNKDADLAAAELKARQARRGLWATPAPGAPWDWRKAQKVPETAPGGQE